ncbi:MAG: large conductance mechanosensitive channel protein MscL [Firmicutes bacterium HGW-Firmicutes-11]|jgi:large conductance mechanosensitive channel|nr:MAG: large conductance mechanosensitive channel protein MscL [Firmicutes bacterium HGW-Firmicutes-11]
MIKEFKEFALRGNVIDMAVGIIIGGAFGKLVTSLVNDLLMPLIGVLMGGVNFTALKIVLAEAELNAAGEVLKPEVAFMYGSFIQAVIDFLIIAFAIFMVIRTMNRMKKKEEAIEEAVAGPDEKELLTEIRDLLKEK